MAEGLVDIPVWAAQPMTHVEQLELDTLCEHLLVLGAGYVGLEFVQAVRRFGSQVTLMDRGKRLLPHEDGAAVLAASCLRQTVSPLGSKAR